MTLDDDNATTPYDEIPVITLDPTAADHHGEAARMREAGPVVRVILPGGVPAWAVTRHAELAGLLNDPRISKNWRNWTACQRGEISDDWPLIGMLKVDTMLTADGAEHHRLRSPVARTFTPRRVAALRPRITEIVTGLIDALPGHADADGVVDLREHFGYQVPMRVICELLGVPGEWRPRLRELTDSLLSAVATPEEVIATQTERVEMFDRLIALRRAEPGSDLTSALIQARDDDPNTFSDGELNDTIWSLVTAGNETTLSLIINSVRALLTHPDQLAALHGQDEPAWAAAVDEVLRWDAPIGNFIARYPTEDITIAGVTIPKGEAIIAPYSGVGRDPAQHGPTAHCFDVSREQAANLAFSGGPHFCPGSHLGRLEGIIAVRELFRRYPGMSLAVPSENLVPVPSIFSNSVLSLPVRLGPIR